MGAYLARRAGQAVLTLLIASVVVFGLLRMIPGDPVAVLAGEDATPEQLAATRHDLGLDRPLVVQYFSWISSLVRGQFGTSLTSRGPVSELIVPAILPTVLMVVGGMLLAIIVALLLGVGAAVSRKSGDAALSGVAAVFYGTPDFWLGLLAILVFAVKLGWLPAGGYVNPFQDPTRGLETLILPWVILGLAMGASLSRFVRSAFIEALASDYVRLALAKGASSFRILAGHAFRNALVPVITVFGVTFAGLLGGAVVLESVFTWPGMGSLMIKSVTARDFPTVQALLMIYVATFVVINFLIDMSYSLIDPRIRMSKEA